jgi:hypothetical protein
VVQQTGGAERGRAAGLHIAKPAARTVQRAWAGRDLPGVGWLLDKIKGLKGYHLFSVVIGKDLIDDKDEERNATTLTEGVLGLFPGGPELFAQLKRAAGALDSAYQWLDGQLKDLGLNEKYFSDLLDKAWDAVKLLEPKESWERIKGVLQEPLNKLLALAKAIFEKLKNIILEAVFQVFPAGKKIWPILQKAGAALTQVAADPVKFATNLFLVVKGGFERFAAKLADNLLDGLQAFVFEEIGIPGLTPPENYQPETLLKMGLEVLGLTYPQLRPKLVKKAEPLGGEVTVSYIEKSVDFIQKVRVGGLTAIWGMIKDKLKSIADSIFDAIEAWTIKEIVTIGMQHIAALANPIGDAIEIIRGIYEIINFFVEKATKMIEFVESIVDTFANIVAGDVGGAAEKVKDTIKKSIPLILRFLAGLFGLSSFGEGIRKAIKTVVDKIDETIGKVLDFLVEKAKPYWDKVKEEITKNVEAIKEWWTKPAKFHYGDEEHELSVEDEGDKPPEVYVNSNRSRLKVFLANHNATRKQTDDALELARGLSWKEGKLVSPSKTEAGHDKFVKLTELMDKLKSEHPLKSVVNDRKEVHSQYGSAMSADAFLSGDLLSGSAPTGTDPIAWTDLGPYLLPPNPPYYVRGHLISEKLGGRGEWTNLMPITDAANGEMERTVEGPLKTALADSDNKNYYHYEVTATYGNLQVPSKASATTPELKLDRAYKAEERLKRLTWTVTAAENDKGEWKSTNLVPRDEKGKPMSKDVRNGYIEATPKPKGS